MSSGADADGDAPPVPSANGREAVLGMLEDACAEAHRKAVSGRVYDEDAENVRQGWFRTLAYCAETYRQLLKDDDLDEMSEMIRRLRERSGTPAEAVQADLGD